MLHQPEFEGIFDQINPNAPSTEHPYLLSGTHFDFEFKQLIEHHSKKSFKNKIVGAQTEKLRRCNTLLEKHDFPEGGKKGPRGHYKGQK